jgi:signal peptidase II
MADPADDDQAGSDRADGDRADGDRADGARGPSRSDGSDGVTDTDGTAEAVPSVRARRAAVAVLFGVAIVAIAIDLVSKQLVVARMTIGEPVTLIPGVLYLNSTRNGGAAFSMGENVTWIFPTIAIAVSVAIALATRRLRSMPWAVSLGLVLGGALGNFIDRLFRAPGPFRGEVVDFISVFSDNGRGFAIFNLADSALVCGVALAILLELTGRHRDGSRVRH